MDVTQEILQHHISYGGSDNTNPQGLSASKSLNFANGASIQKPIVERLSRIPYTYNFKDTVGLFGVENTFVRVDCDIQDTTILGSLISQEEDGYLTIIWNPAEFPVEDSYEQAKYEGWPFPPNTPEGDARLSGELAKYNDPYISVDLQNLKTGNKYIDSWLDVRLYTSKREEHPYDLMFIKPTDFFYIGFHARNTRRLPYNVTCTVGAVFTSSELMTPAQRALIAR